MKTYWFLFNSKHSRGFDEITFCAESLHEALDIFYEWHTKEFDQDVPVIRNIEHVYNKDDHEFYKESYISPDGGAL
jgi:hypothetical protein